MEGAGLELEPRGRQRSNLLSTIKQPGADGDPMINLNRPGPEKINQRKIMMHAYPVDTQGG
jgi:hypothetical protein